MRWGLLIFPLKSLSLDTVLRVLAAVSNFLHHYRASILCPGVGCCGAIARDAEKGVVGGLKLFCGAIEE